MNSVLTESVFFGVSLSIFAYAVGTLIKKKFDKPFVSPLLIAMVLIIAFLKIFQIDYETYDYGAKYITYFIQPATVCLAIPLYKQVKILYKHPLAILCAVIVGCLSHVLVITLIGLWLKTDEQLLASLLSKSVTTAFALDITNELGGITSITVLGLSIAGLFGATLGPSIMKICHIDEPVAQGLGIGAASHALGTSRAVELGEVQAAMGTVSIVITGVLTVIIAPIAAQYLY